MEQLKRNRGNIVRIEVNDEGEFITINLADAEFPNRFYELYQNVQNRLKDIEEKKPADSNTTEQLEYVRNLNKGNADDIDKLFGEDTCRKVFGVVPDIYAVIDFFEEIIPILENAIKKRNNSIKSKYNPKRRGKR